MQRSFIFSPLTGIKVVRIFWEARRINDAEIRGVWNCFFITAYRSCIKPVPVCGFADIVKSGPDIGTRHKIVLDYGKPCLSCCLPPAYRMGIIRRILIISGDSVFAGCGINAAAVNSGNGFSSDQWPGWITLMNRTILARGVVQSDNTAVISKDSIYMGT